MSDRLRLATIVGTRPELIKLSEVIRRCDEVFEHVLIHTGQNYDYSLNGVFFDELGIRPPDAHLEVAGGQLGDVLGAVIARSYRALHDIQPDAVLTLGDTNSCLSVISAKRLRIPTFHMEGGNRCFDENLPEETNRRIVDHLSDVNLCYSEHARRNLIAEGRPAGRTFVIGSPMAEVLTRHRTAIDASNVIERLGLATGQYFVLSTHREENVDDAETLREVVDVINELAEVFDKTIVFSVHPRTRSRLDRLGAQLPSRVLAMAPMGLVDYVRLQRDSFCVVSDSGTLAEESSHFGFPAVSLRTSTERPEAIDRARFVLGGITKRSVLQAVRMATMPAATPVANVPDYTDRNTSDKVVRIIQGYTNVINELVWRKPR